jgi:predicted nucleic acid-binding protein
VILLDSNIVIYLRDPRWGEIIANQFNEEGLHTCNVVVAEVLGFKGLEKIDARYFEQLLSTMTNHMFSDVVTDKVVELRKAMTIQLPDAIIAATALTHKLTLWTHNTGDFNVVPGLLLFDPLPT